MKKLLTEKSTWASAIFLLLLFSMGAVPDKGGLSPDQERGKQIYNTGTAGDGDNIIAVVSGINVPASAMPCSNCHGAQGKGNPEPAVAPSNLSWSSLSQPSEGKAHNGRIHPPYTEKGLVKAISMGMDPGGNELQKGMPRYQMSKKSMIDLIAYLKVIGG
jgi:hypothetical protein